MNKSNLKDCIARRFLRLLFDGVNICNVIILFAKIVMSRPRGVYISPSFSSTRPTCYLPVLAGGVAAAEEGVAKHSSGPRSVSQSKDT